MSSEIKTSLKEVRELLKQNEYTEVIKKCKKILKKEKNNYTALILLGAAMKELQEFKEQAPLAFQRAIDLQPDNPLAWQGLVACYEKNSEDREISVKLIQACGKVFELNSDDSKAFSFLEKITNVALKSKDDSVIFVSVKLLQQLRDVVTRDKQSLINKSLAFFLVEQFGSSDQFKDLLEDVLANVTKDLNVINRQDYYRRYLQLLYTSGKIDTLLTEAILMHQEFEQDTCPLEWICQVYYEKNLHENKEQEKIDIIHFYEALLKLNAESESGSLAQALHLERIGNPIASRDVLNHLVTMKPQSVYGWLLLCRINRKLYCWDDVENAARRALQLVNSTSNMQRELQVTLVEAMSKSNSKDKLKLAAKLCTEILSEESSTRAILIFTRVNVLLNNPEVLTELKEMELKDETRVEAVILHAMFLKNLKQLEEAADVLGAVLETSEGWSLLGKIYWEMADYSHSLMAFLNSIRADRYNWESLIYLGRYYREYSNDIERSRKCYQTALQINPNSEEAGVGLSTTYRLLKNSEANMQLLQKLTIHGSGPKWAWLQLGLYYLDKEDANQAIKALQHVIRADPSDNHGWESLADAYWLRGAYTSALKSYQRALDLRPEALYPMIQVANIKLIIGQLEEAKEDFEKISSNEPHYVPALKGFAETCLGLAKRNIARQFLGRAKENLQQAIECLTNAVLHHSNLSCIWKLLGDVCYRSATMSEKYSYLKVIPALMKHESTEKYIIIQRKDLFVLATRCYCRALSLSKDSALLWHNLACCYYSQLILDSSVIDRKDIAAKSLTAAKYAVKLYPTSWQHWNLLAVICMHAEIKNYALAQHCYVMAIDKESNNALIWSNLGTLYLYIGDVYRANEAFSRAQRADPAYINSWIGQAIIAEMTKNREAMDLFRHSALLGYHSQACLGYSHWVLTTLLDPTAKKDPLYTYTIENMHAVSVASDMLTWYLEHHLNDSYALNAHGLLLERQQLYLLAAERFTMSLRVSKHEQQQDIVRINLSRVLIHLNRLAEATQLCQNVRVSNFNSQCHLALCLFKAKRYEESYMMYETALHWLANSESEKANTLCAMAAMAHIFQGVDDVKTLLFQCIQIQPPMIFGFLAAASLGILHGDLNLTALVLNELQPYQDHPEYGHHIIMLKAYSFLMQNNVVDTIRVLSKAVHRYPNDVNHWTNLVKILLETDLMAFVRCTEKALFLGRSTSSINVVHLACLSALSNLGNKNETNSLRSIQKTLFQFPGQIESWASFIAILLSRSIMEKNSRNHQWMVALISTVQKQHSMKQQMAEWLINNEKMLSSK